MMAIDWTGIWSATSPHLFSVVAEYVIVPLIAIALGFIVSWVRAQTAKTKFEFLKDRVETLVDAAQQQLAREDRKVWVKAQIKRTFPRLKDSEADAMIEAAVLWLNKELKG